MKIRSKQGFDIKRSTRGPYFIRRKLIQSYYLSARCDKIFKCTGTKIILPKTYTEQYINFKFTFFRVIRMRPPSTAYYNSTCYKIS